MGLLSCFGCGGPLVPADHTELGREELKRLYERSMQLNNGRLIVHGIFARANTKNNNKRVYPKYILKREVAKYEAEHIRRGTALGELDHPNYASRYFKCLNLPNISHQVLEVHWKGDMLWGTIEILSTPSGLLLWELYSQGIKLGVSSRGWASLRTDPKAKCVYVDEDFELITFDFVTEPSTKGAYLVPIMRSYSDSVPDQRRAQQVAHLGHGVVSMRNIPHLPDTPILVARINQLQQLQQQRVQQQQQQQQNGGPLIRAHALDQLLLYSHYLVFPQLAYLDREQHARDFQSHLAMFATRAHLADQHHLMSRADLNAIILKEIAKEEAAAGGGGAGAAGAGGGQLEAVTAVVSSSKVAGASVQGPVVAGELHGGRLTPVMPAASCQQQPQLLLPPPLQQQCGQEAAVAEPFNNRSLGGASLGGPAVAVASGVLLQPGECVVDDSLQQGQQGNGTQLQGAGSADLNAWVLHPNACDPPPLPPAVDTGSLGGGAQAAGATGLATSLSASSGRQLGGRHSGSSSRRASGQQPGLPRAPSIPAAVTGNFQAASGGLQPGLPRVAGVLAASPARPGSSGSAAALSVPLAGGAGAGRGAPDGRISGSQQLTAPQLSMQGGGSDGTQEDRYSGGDGAGRGWGSTPDALQRQSSSQGSSIQVAGAAAGGKAPSPQQGWPEANNQQQLCSSVPAAAAAAAGKGWAAEPPQPQRGCAAQAASAGTGGGGAARRSPAAPPPWSVPRATARRLRWRRSSIALS